MELTYMDIDKSNIPYRFQMDLKSKTLGFEIRYNTVFDYFTMNVFDKEWNVLASGKKLVIGVNVLSAIYDEAVPEGIEIIPYDLSATVDRITWENFTQSVKIYILEVSSE